MTDRHLIPAEAQTVAGLAPIVAPKLAREPAVSPILAHHDHQQFEIFCYSSVRRPDSATERFRQYADTWREVRALGDAQLAEQIRQDRIDILVDLTQHMADNRLPTFARKPAPVQVCYLAYPGTSGLRSIDYFITGAGGKLRRGRPNAFEEAHTLSWSDTPHFLLVKIEGDRAVTYRGSLKPLDQ